VLSALEAREVSAWIEPARGERALRVLSDPRLRVTRVGSPDARTRRQFAEHFGAVAFDDMRRLAIETPSVLWIDRNAPLDEMDRAALVDENIAIVAGACTLSFLLALPQVETAPSFRRMAAGNAVLGIAEAFGAVEVLQSTVSVGNADLVNEGLRTAAAAALAVLGPIDLVTAFGARAGTLTASVVGARGFGTLAVATGVEGACFALVGDGGIASVTSGGISWKRKDGVVVEEERLEADGVEPIVRTILEAEKPEPEERTRTSREAHGARRGRRAIDDAHRRMRLRIAALADTLRLSIRTGQPESVDSMLQTFGLDPVDLLPRD
jgi:hypothetical protein